MTRGTRFKRLIPTIVIVTGLAIMATPSVASFVSDVESRQVIQTMTSVDDESRDPSVQEMLRNADAYNARLAGLPTDVSDIWGYDRQLAVDGARMGWVEIPKIRLRYPVYHGVDEPALSAGVGHLPASALPIGGKGTHCVLTAHSGLGTQAGFDDIRDLVPGDKVYMHVPGRDLAYEVTGSEVVWPYEVDHLQPHGSDDLMTLVTCTPFGVNDHRLFVHCRRVPYVGNEPGDAQGVIYVRKRDFPVLVAVAAVGCATLASALVGRHRRRRRMEGDG